MSLKTVFLVYLNFDTFQNIGIIERGTYRFRVSLMTNMPCKVLSCDSAPVVKHNVGEHRDIRDSEYSYEPCYIDFDRGVFLSRQFSLSQEFEFVSLRDSVSWRVENFDVSLGSVNFEFKVELLALSGALHEEGTAETLDEGTVIGVHRIKFCNVGAETVFQNNDLIFLEPGVCEIRGLSSCSLVDIRYDHNFKGKKIPDTFESFLFDRLDTADDIRRVYLEFYSLVIKCMELSFNSISRLISAINSKYRFDEKNESGDETLELYPYLYVIAYLNFTVSPSAHYQSVLKDSRRKSQRQDQSGHHRHLSDDQNNRSNVASPVAYQSRDGQAQYNSHGPSVSSSTIAFAKSQTVTLAEVANFNKDECVPSQHDGSSDVNTNSTTSCSVSPCLDEYMDNDKKGVDSSQGYSSYSPLDECECYPDYNDFDDDASDCSNEIPPRPSSSSKLQSLLGGVSLSNSAECEVLIPPQQEEMEYSNISQLKKNLSTRLCFNLTACSCQIWVIHSTFTSLVSQNVSIITRAMSLKLIDKILEQMKYERSVVSAPLQEVDGRGIDVESRHRQFFEARRKDAESTAVHRRLVSVLTSRFSNRSTTASDTKEDHLCVSGLCEVFRDEECSNSDPDAKPWTCINPACKKQNHPLLTRCQYCLWDAKANQSLHLVFILHGFKANPFDMKKVKDLISLTYPHVRCKLIQACYTNCSQSLHYLADTVVNEMLAKMRYIKEQTNYNINRISFVAHSLGGLVFRLAMNDPRMQEYQPLYHLFLSLNVPHVGVPLSYYRSELGGKLFLMLTKSNQLDEVCLQDNRDMRQTTLYQMSKHSGFDKFKFFYIMSSMQDTLIPFYSERAEVNPQIEQSSREESLVVSEMVDNFWSDLKKEGCKTVIKKFDICSDRSSAMETFSGHTAHTTILTDLNILCAFVMKIRECFS